MTTKSKESVVSDKSSVINIEQEKVDLRKTEQPLIDVKVTNPITYIKSWWKKIIGNEGVDFRIRVKPLTAIAITIIVVTVSFGVGRFVFPFKVPFFEYTLNSPTIAPVNSTRDAAFSGVLRYDDPKGRYYLLTSSAEAITLAVPENIDLSKYIGRRIFSVGKYDKDKNILAVESASDMELLPSKTETIPTDTPTATPTTMPTLTPQPTETISS
jgi:hypothetical protein